MTLLLLSAACVSERALFTAPDPPGGRSDATNPLIGTWETVLVIQTTADFQTWTTTWNFGTGGTCGYHQLVRSLLLGDSVRQRQCTWTTSVGQLTITWDDDGTTIGMPYSFPVGRTDQVTLEGIEYRRTG